MEGGDSEYEEDEMVVLAELNGLIDEELLTNGCSYQFVGIETDKPVLQLGKYNFLGSYEDQIGSALFLGQTTDAEGRKTWSKLCFSDKKLSMQRVFLRKKGEEPPIPSADAEAMEEGPIPGAENGGGPEPGPSSAADGERPEPEAGRAAAGAAAGGDSDVDVPSTESSEAAPAKARDSTDIASEGNED